MLFRSQSSCMPLRGRSQLSDNRVFFVTTSVRGHSPIFADPAKCRDIMGIISSFGSRHEIIILGYVIMPTHLHLLLASRRGGPTVSGFMRDIKRVSAKEFAPTQGGLWESRFDDVAIISKTQFLVKLNYIHNNPVRAGLAIRAERSEERRVGKECRL